MESLIRSGAVVRALRLWRTALGAVALPMALVVTVGFAVGCADRGPGRGPVSAYVPLWAEPADHGGTAAVDLGPAPATAPIAARVYLAGRDPAGLAAYATAVADPHDAYAHRFLTPEQVRSRFGPSSTQLASVRSWLEAAGLRIVETSPHFVSVTGTAEAAERAFGVAWHSYRVQAGLPQQGKVVATTDQQAPPPRTPISVPESVRTAVLTVAPRETRIPGYDDSPNTQPAVSVAPTEPVTEPPPSAAGCSHYFAELTATTLPTAYGRPIPYGICGYTGRQLRNAYGVPADRTGRGVRIAEVGVDRTLTTPQTVATSAVRQGYPLRPGQFTEIVAAGVDASCQPEGPRFSEDFADIEQLHGMAPDADLASYDAACDDDGQSMPMLDAYSAITDGHTSDIVASAWNARYNEATLSPGLIAAYEQIFQQSAAEGIGVYVDSDDEGDNSSVSPNHQPSVSYPDIDPWVTAVGGTGLAIGPDDKYEWETSWGDRTAELTVDGRAWADPPGRFTSGGGGGTSTIFAQPAYQRSVVPDRLSRARTERPMRVIPDIAAAASSGTGILVGIVIPPGLPGSGHYREFAFGGTSSSVQLIAAMQSDAEQDGVAIGFANPRIYARAGTPAFHDVTATPPGAPNPPAVVLSNPASATAPPQLITLGQDQTLTATSGFDNTTGVGTPAPEYFP